MSESKVPLPTPIGVDEQAGLMFNMKALCAYGDARAAEARRLALLEAIAICEAEGDGWVDHTSKLVGYHCAHKLRALADEVEA